MLESHQASGPPDGALDSDGALDIDGAWVVTPHIHADGRGSFLEWFQGSDFQSRAGYRFEVAQANCSVSGRGVIRGIHFADVPPGQAKYVTCVSGTVIDVVVDLRAGSPSFGRWAAVQLDDRARRAVFISEGLGHAFATRSEEATVMYLCSTSYEPAHERGINPLDPEIAIAWPNDVEPILSGKDKQAPSLAQARADGLLPDYAECLAHAARLVSPGGGQ